MREHDVKADDLLNGASLRVVLHPDPEFQTDFPDMIESFSLPHIIIHGGEFIAKTANRHALAYDYRAYDMNSAFSYAYSNFLSYVINCSAAEPFIRLYSTTAYQEIKFVAKNGCETVWEYGSTVSMRRRPRWNERSMPGSLKIALLDQDGLWNIHPVHMPSFYVGRNHFELFTEQDALPIVFRYAADLKKLEKHFLENIKRNKRASILRSALMSENVIFYSCYTAYALCSGATNML